MVIYENVYGVSREYNERFETLYVPISNKTGLLQRLLANLRPAGAVRLTGAAGQLPTQSDRNTAA